MELSFSKEEIKKAIFGLGADKEPGPDGFPLSFSQKYWNIIEPDIIALCDGFHDGSINLERINWASIVLIPKKGIPEGSNDYRPISLINASLKILSNLLASLLSRLLDSLVNLLKLHSSKDVVFWITLSWQKS